MVLRKEKRKKSHYQGQRISDFAQLKPGDYVVHENYGLGIYRGTERQIVDKVTKDYIKIEYGDGGKLYFPVTQLHMIQKYADSESKQPKLNKLNGQEWTKQKAVFKSSQQHCKGACRAVCSAPEWSRLSVWNRHCMAERI